MQEKKRELNNKLKVRVITGCMVNADINIRIDNRKINIQQNTMPFKVMKKE